jgi:hypothetical protein
MCPVCFKEERGYNLLWGDQTVLWLQERLAEIKEREEKARAEAAALKEELKQAKRATKLGPPGTAFDRTFLKTLISLCHPDLHHNSEKATAATKRLLAMRSTTK